MSASDELQEFQSGRSHLHILMRNYLLYYAVKSQLLLSKGVTGGVVGALKNSINLTN